MINLLPLLFLGLACAGAPAGSAHPKSNCRGEFRQAQPLVRPNITLTDAQKAQCRASFGPPVLGVDVGADGAVSNVLVLASGGCTEVDSVVAKAARSWKYRAATCDGSASRDRLVVTVTLHSND